MKLESALTYAATHTVYTAFLEDILIFLLINSPFFIKDHRVQKPLENGAGSMLL